MTRQFQAPPAKYAWFSGINRCFGKPASRSGTGSGACDTGDYQGGLMISTGSITAVSIANIAEVMSHQVFRAIGSTSHAVRFVGGGDLRYACNDRGQVIAMSATGVRSEVSARQVLSAAALNGR